MAVEISHELTLKNYDNVILFLEKLIEEVEIEENQEVKDKIIKKKIEDLENDFYLNEEDKERIASLLKEFKIKSDSQKVKLDKPDSLILEAFCLRTNTRIKKEYVDWKNHKVDIWKVHEIMKSGKEKYIASYEKTMKEEAIKRIKERGEEVNAESLSKEANISLEEADKFLRIKNRAKKAARVKKIKK